MEVMSKEVATKRSLLRMVRGTRAGAVILSWDLLVGVPVGFLASLSALFSEQVRGAMPTVLLAVGGVGAAVATLVLTSLSVLLGVVSPSYRRIVEEAPGGVPGIVRPFRFVMAVAAAATAWSLVAAGVVPLISQWPWMVFVAAGIAFGLLLWAVFGSVQLTDQLIQHMAWSKRAEEAEKRILEARKRIG